MACAGALPHCGVMAAPLSHTYLRKPNCYQLASMASIVQFIRVMDGSASLNVPSRVCPSHAGVPPLQMPIWARRRWL
jgi:hypothetical protein